MNGRIVAGVLEEDVLTSVNLKRSWQYVTIQNELLNLLMKKQSNKVVTAKDALVPGDLPTGTRWGPI
jgi:hypothetical protein